MKKSGQNSEPYQEVIEVLEENNEPFEGTFKQVRERMYKIEEKYPDHFDFVFDTHYRPPNSWYWQDNVILGTRWETEEEYEKRLKRKEARKKSEAKRKATVLANQKKKLEALKQQVQKLEQQVKGA